MIVKIRQFCQSICNRLKLIIGLVLPADSTKSLDEDNAPSIIVLNDQDFAIIFRKDTVEGVIPTIESLQLSDKEKEDHLLHVENTIAYVIHALMREDWKEDFFDAVEEYLNNAPSESEVEALRRRSEFKLITNKELEDDDSKR